MTTRFIRQQRRARSTGTLISVLDLDSPDSDTLNEGQRWETVCEDHGFVCSHPTLDLARSHAACPEGWCEACAEAIAAKEDDHE
jgi:hypothetical protein